jgi:hypothetical protein
MVSLNRETVPPQTPRLVATFAGSTGQSPGITVRAPAFTKDATATVEPVTARNPFGWADLLVFEPAVMYDGTGFRMYFAGAGVKQLKPAVGVATSSDGGKSFTPRPDPVWKPADNTFYSGSTLAPAPFRASGAFLLAFSGADPSTGVDLTPPSQIGVATSPDGLAPFTIDNGGKPVLKRQIPGVQGADCDYCDNSIDFANVIDDPSAGVLSDGGFGGKLMFFSAQQKNNIPSIGRASSADGITWVPEPAPVLSGDLGGETILTAPKVMVDGTVFKMWYTFARGIPGSLFKSFCDATLDIGYATSSDGFYWVRSPTNSKQPPITSSASGWDAGTTVFIAGSVVALDGNDPTNGLAVYYTTLRHANPADPTSACLPNGIGRATRP